MLPSRAIAGIPVEALASDDTRIVSYAPSATVFKYLREQRHAPAAMPACWPWATRPSCIPTRRVNPSLRPITVCWSMWSRLAPTPPLTASNRRRRRRCCNGHGMTKKNDLKVVIEGDKPIAVEVWRDGRSSLRAGPGKRRGHRLAAGTGSDRRESGDG